METLRDDIFDVSFTSSDRYSASSSSSSFHSVDGHTETIAGVTADAVHSIQEFLEREERKRVVIYETMVCKEDSDVEEISDGRLGSFRDESCESMHSSPKFVESPPTKPQQDTSPAYKEPLPADHLEEPGAKRAEASRRRGVVATEAVGTDPVQFRTPISPPARRNLTPRATTALFPTPVVQPSSASSTPRRRQSRSPRTSPRVHEYGTASLSSLVPINQSVALAHRANVLEASARMLEAYRKKPRRTTTVGTQTRARLYRRTAHETNVDVEELDIKRLSTSSSDDWDVQRAAVADKKRMEQEERERANRQREEEREREKRQREEEERLKKEKERINSIQFGSSPAPLFTPGSHKFSFSATPPPTEGIAAKSRPADGLKDKTQGSDLPPRKGAIPMCKVSTELSGVVQHPVRVTRY